MGIVRGLCRVFIKPLEKGREWYLMSKINWARMTWLEIRQAQKRNPVVIIPIGTVETHGPHTIVGLE
ncbi:MAG: creatininase family protein, partial [Anaerolineae bacterium]